MKTISLRKYIGRAYEDFDCFDLVKEFYLDHYKLDVRNYFDGLKPTPSQVQSLIVTNRGDFVSIGLKDAKFGDLVSIKLKGLECHLGVVIDKIHFLHSVRGPGSVLERFERFKHLIVGVYRHRELGA